ncbi:MAG TPA: Cof-type HAD-IIB family hydrolase [Chloroflexia bacterium]|nr:Cof-type HAD-IIB family hydrolase [Chloroflexia bacterium]
MTDLPYKLLALDLDGTLITDDLVIVPEAKAAIAAAIERGVVVTLATGRMFRSAVQFARELELSAPLICYQGAMVRHSITGETIFHLPIQYELARRFIELSHAHHYHVHTYVDDHLCVATLNKEAMYYAELARVEPEVVGDLLQFIDRPERAPTKLVIVTEEQETLTALNTMQAAFKDELYVTRSHPLFTEAVDPKCSKGAALEALAKSLDIPREQVIAVGDNLNDLPMLEWAGLGVAVANSTPGVKEKARFVTERPIAQGVVEVIQRFILNT